MAFILTFSAVGADAQALSFINAAPDAASLAMGSAQGCMPTASIFSSDRGYAGATYMMWQPNGVTATKINVGGRFRISDKFALVAGYRSNLYEKFEITDATSTIAGTFTPKESLAEVGAAFGIGDRLALSLTGKLITSTLQSNKGGSALGVDLGAAYAIDAFYVGAHLRNFGSKISYGANSYPLPTRVGIEASDRWSFAGAHSVTLNVDADYQLPENGRSFVASAGLAYSFKELISLRAGYHVGSNAAVEPSFASVGLGIRVVGICLDLAYLVAGSDSALGNTLAATLGYAF